MKSTNRHYAAIRQLVERIGGDMSYAPRPPGGVWTIVLNGRRLDVRVASGRINELDGVYEAPTPAPVRWKDFPLRADAFWRLVELIQKRGRPI